MVKYPLALTSWDESEIQAIHKVIEKGMYTMSDFVYQFERDFSKFLGSNYCVMVNSGSSANLLAVAALFYTKKPLLKPGDEVIVPAVSWPTTYFPLCQYGLKLKFVDINLDTLNMDITQLARAISDKTKAIFLVNLLGNPNEFTAIQNLIDGKDIILLEDNCESLGARFDGRQAGTFGVMGTFSSFFSHHISTMEGGVITTNHEELYHILLSIRAHGWTRQLPEKNKLVTKDSNPFKESFRFILPGYNVRPLEMSGAIGIEQLKKLPGFIEQRRLNAKYFCERFHNHPFITIQQEIGMSSWFGFSMVLKPDSGIVREDVVSHLMSKGIDCRPIVTGNFTKNEVLRYFTYELAGEMRNADYIDQNGWFVGNHHIPLQDQIDFLHQTLNHFI
jgi:CDP-6-deoxy-D-xylo-4-hexulose-3-dehydrase